MDFSSLKMRRMSWPVLVSLVVVMLMLCAIAVVRNNQQLGELDQKGRELNVKLGSLMRTQHTLSIQLDEVGSAGMMNSTARAEDFVKPGELRFFIDNSQNVLEMYTEEEWQTMSNEMIDWY